MLLKGFQVSESAVFVNKSILVPLCSFFLADNTGLGDKLNVDLNSLAGILHLFIRLWNVLGIWKFGRHRPSFA